jgi:hypothetical protein
VDRPWGIRDALENNREENGYQLIAEKVLNREYEKTRSGALVCYSMQVKGFSSLAVRKADLIVLRKVHTTAIEWSMMCRGLGPYYLGFA